MRNCKTRCSEDWTCMTCMACYLRKPKSRYYRKCCFVTICERKVPYCPWGTGENEQASRFLPYLTEEKSTFALVYPHVKILARTAFRCRSRLSGVNAIFSQLHCVKPATHETMSQNQTCKVISERRVQFCPQRSLLSSEALWNEQLNLCMDIYHHHALQGGVLLHDG